MNRCDVPALQRKDLEQRLKEQLYSLVDSRLRVLEWAAEGGKGLLLVGIRKSLGKSKTFGLRKWAVFETCKERLVQKKGFWFEKAGDFQVRLKRIRQKTTFWFTEKANFFSSCKATR